MTYCVLCGRWISVRTPVMTTCSDCAAVLASCCLDLAGFVPSPMRFIEDPRGVSAFVAYTYTGPLVQLIHDSKIRGHIPTAKFLARAFVRSLETGQIGKGITAVMPCPSSLWSRVRGRLDLARILAESVADAWKIPLLPPPKSLMYSHKKRAQKKARNQIFFADDQRKNTPHFEALDTHPQTLIVDDVLTTGFTLNSVVHAVNGRFCRFAALASPHPERWQPTRLGWD